MALLLSLAGAPSAAPAQGLNPMVRSLLSAHGTRARVRAARAVGRMRPEGARAALLAALEDASSTVRCAAATALGDLGDPSAAGALTAHLQDHNPRVQDASRRALIALRVSPGSVAQAAPAPSAPQGSRYLVTVGQVQARPGVAPELRLAFRAALEQEVARHPRLTLQPSQATSASRWSLEGTLLGASHNTLAGGTSARAEVSLVLLREPLHAIAGTLHGMGTARAEGSLGAPSAVEFAAVRDALRSALTALESHLGEAPVRSARR
ncbi:MAG: HEAT repeat domain-containing protein [Deltaproteobacteria bacterium]|nr:HEAT repeat domain-containing protein [Deltaproteobacteria bacterium]